MPRVLEPVCAKRVELAPVAWIICDNNHEPGLALPVPVCSTLKRSCDILTGVTPASAHVLTLLEAVEELSILSWNGRIEKAPLWMENLNKRLLITVVTEPKYRAMKGNFNPRIRRVVENLTRDRVL